MLCLVGVNEYGRNEMKFAICCGQMFKNFIHSYIPFSRTKHNIRIQNWLKSYIQRKVQLRISQVVPHVTVTIKFGLGFSFEHQSTMLVRDGLSIEHLQFCVENGFTYVHFLVLTNGKCIQIHLFLLLRFQIRFMISRRR